MKREVLVVYKNFLYVISKQTDPLTKEDSFCNLWSVSKHTNLL